MNKIIQKNFLFIFLTFAICLFGFILRHQNYTTVPLPGETRDEFSFAWLGLSLIQKGEPLATSGLSPYPHDWRYINVNDIFHGFANSNPFPIDGPWFDHPPLFSLIPGFYAYTRGVTNFADTSLSLIRRPMIYLGTFNILLVIILGTLVFNSRIGLIAGLIYATDPLIVISSRLVQAENFLVTLFLLTIIFYFLYRRYQKYIYFWLAISLSALATLVKLSGIGIALSLFLLFLILEPKKDKLKKSLTLIFCTGLVTLFFPVYGYFYDWKLFINVFFSNSGRYFRDGLAGFYWLISKTNITRTFLDSWVLLSWIGTFFAIDKISKNKKLYYLIVPIFSYLLIYLVFGSEGYGWYKFPFYPFLFLVLAWVLNYFFRKDNSFAALFLLLLSGGLTIDKVFPPEKLQNFMWPFRLGCLFLLLLTFLPHFNLKNFPAKKYSRFLNFLIFILCLVINVYVNLQITPSAWYQIK